MKLVATVLPLFVAGALAWPFNRQCSADSGPACTCPKGTDYQISTTYAIVGSSAQDFKSVTFDFFNTAWTGLTPFATSGSDNAAGQSKRSFHLPTAKGTYDVTEELFKEGTSPDGSYYQVYGQAPETIPLPYQDGSGSFSGYYNSLVAHSTGPSETAVAWNVYACFTGKPLDFAAFHEGALNSAISILQSQGKIKGKTVPPHSF